MTILYFFNVAVTESIIQHALNQTVKEYAQYIYAGEKILTVTKISENDSNKAGIFEYMKQLIYDDNDTDKAELNDENMLELIDNIISLATNSGIDEIRGQVVGKIITPVMRKYINNAKTMQEAHEKLVARNISAGLYGLDFSNSSLLKDGKQILLVVEYEIEPTFWRFFQKKIYVRQTSSTGVWLNRNARNSNDLKEISTKWQLAPLARGKEFLKEVRAENYEIAVKPGYGLDLYNNGSGYFYFSLNIFTAHYSTFHDNDTSYTLNTENILTQLRTYVQKTNTAIGKLPSSIEMENGTMQAVDTGALVSEIHIIVPEEATQFMTELQTVAETIRSASGIKIVWHFQEKYLI